MQLLTQQLIDKIPKLYSQDNAGQDAIIYCKYFTPDSSWTWYVLEFDGVDTFFGLVNNGDGKLEYGYFSLSELCAVKGGLGLGVERDLHFRDITIGELIKKN